MNKWLINSILKENFRPKVNVFTANRILTSHIHIIYVLVTVTIKINITDSQESAILVEVKKLSH